MEEHEHEPLPSMPNARRQAWSATIAIVVIVLMIIVGARYAWDKRTAKLRPALTATSTTFAQ